MVALSFAVAAAEYMYRPPPHLLHGPPHGPPPHGHGPPPHKHHHYSAAKGPGGGPGKHGPSRHPPPPHYHGRPHHWPRKPPPSLSSLSSPWKTSPFKAPKDPFRVLGSDADFGNQAAVLSALKSSGSSSSLSHGPSTVYGPSTATSPLQSQVVHAHPWHRPANVISDDYGPIHTIPAPNLSAADKPSHLSLGSSYNALEQQALQRQAIKSALSQLTAAKLAGPTAAPVVHHTQGYQVSEPQTVVQEGATHLYAPDPDPSRPAPKLKPTLDPHSLPSEGRGPHFSIDPQFGAVSSHPGYVSQTSSLSPQDLFHLLNGFPLQHGMQPQQIEIMHHGLSGDALAADHQQLQQLQQLQQQHLQQLQQQHLQQQLQAQAAQSLHQLQPANFEPHYESFDFDEQSYQKSLFHDQQDHEGSEDAPRPSVQRPDEAVVQQESSPSTVSLFTVPQPTSSTPLRGDIRSEDDHDEEAVEEYDDDAEAERPREAFRGSSTTPQQAAVTPAPAADEEDEQDNLQQVVEAPDSYSEDPSLTPTFRRQPNSVHVPEKQGRLPYGARIRPKRIAIE